MNTSRTYPGLFSIPGVLMLALVLLSGVGLGFGLDSWLEQRRIANVAQRGAQVMPFDLDRTLHVFERTDDGGLQTVTARAAADHDQIALIRAHLREEAASFSRGDFSDPAAIHGDTMPGLAELRASAGQIDVRYSDLPDGAQISYRTDDPALIEALHHWFAAQLSDHGQHAAPGRQH